MTENILCELCDLLCITNGYINFRLRDMNKHKIRTEIKRKKMKKEWNEKSGKINNRPISLSNKFVITNLVSISMNIKYQLLWMFFNLFLMTAWKFHSNFNLRRLIGTITFRFIVEKLALSFNYIWLTANLRANEKSSDICFLQFFLHIPKLIIAKYSNTFLF